MAAQHSFFRRFVKREAQPRPADPADMGTAFGLEAILGPASEFVTDEEVGDEGSPAPEQAPMDWLAHRRKPRP